MPFNPSPIHAEQLSHIPGQMGWPEPICQHLKSCWKCFCFPWMSPERQLMGTWDLTQSCSPCPSAACSWEGSCPRSYGTGMAKTEGEREPGDEKRVKSGGIIK